MQPLLERGGGGSSVTHTKWCQDTPLAGGREAPPSLLLALIPPSTWKGDSANFGFIGLSEVCIDPSSILGVVYSAAPIFNKFRRGKLLLDAVDDLRDRFHHGVDRLPPVLPEPDLGRSRRFV